MTDCLTCQEHVNANPLLIGACASVGIEHGTSTATTLDRYLAVFHRNGHRDQTGGRGRRGGTQ